MIEVNAATAPRCSMGGMPREGIVAMVKNVGMVDRAIRAVIGLALIIWALSGGPVWAWIGVIPLLTAIFAVCPAYSILGIRTCPMANT